VAGDHRVEGWAVPLLRLGGERPRREADHVPPHRGAGHDEITARSFLCAVQLLPALDDAEYAYMIQRGGEGYPERAYGIEYRR
jgi:hypothetical protein